MARKYSGIPGSTLSTPTFALPPEYKPKRRKKKAKKADKSMTFGLHGDEKII